MLDISSATVRAVLATLLDQAEQPRRRREPRVRLNARRHSEYFADAAARRVAHEAFAALTADGLIRLFWKPWEAGNWLEAVELVREGLPALYARLGRTPAEDQRTRLLARLAGARPVRDWHVSFIAWAQQRLAAGETALPLQLAGDRWNADLLAALAALAALEGPTLERVLSVRLFGDSKRLGVLRGPLVAVLRRHAPGAEQYGGDVWALLRAHHLDRVPEYVLASGALVLHTAVGDLDLAGVVPSIGLPAPFLLGTRSAQTTARVVVTVENVASFTELAARRPPSSLIVWTGGFASPAVVGLLRAIRAGVPGLPLYHWGDMDAGGLRILAHLRRELSAVAPLAMDADTHAAHAGHGRPLTAKDRAALIDLQAEPLLADCVPLVEQLLALDRKLEQEAVSPDWVVERLARLP